MSIKSTLGSISNIFQDGISTAKNKIQSSLETIVGSTTSAFTNLYSGGFVGMSESAFQNLQTDIDTYCTNLEEKVEEACNATKNQIQAAYKGTELESAVDVFIDAVKKLIKGYCSSMRQDISEASEAYRNFTAATKSVASDVESSATDIESSAKDIQLDMADVDTNLSSN